MLPEEFKERMKDMLGEEYPAFERSLEKEPCRALRVNMGKITTEAFLRISPFALRRVPWTEEGFYYEQTEERPGRHPFHEAGLYYIQEPSAMAPAAFLEALPGERVLDLCAAPGGKSTQIGAAMKGKGLLVSNEIHPARARILSENVERMGLVNTVVTNEAPERLAEFFPEYFDKILVDAPCSGEGMFRKNEEAKTEWSVENVKLCAKRQDGILDAAADMLRAGGRLLYSTCTFSPEEDEGSVSRFLHRHPDFTLLPMEAPEGFFRGRPDWIQEPAPNLEYTLRIMPHKVLGEGHYLALLQRKGAGSEEAPCFDRKRGRKGRGPAERGGEEKQAAEYRDFTAFCEENLRDFPYTGSYLRFGDQLYLTPKELPSLRGLKVLRPGLHLGTFKKNRLEPSHALALALQPGQAERWVDLDAESEAVLRFLNGQSLQLQEVKRYGTAEEETWKADTPPKGWCLVCVEGCSLGWGKLSDGVIKNHYPKGLRKG